MVLNSLLTDCSLIVRAEKHNNNKKKEQDLHCTITTNTPLRDRNTSCALKYDALGRTHHHFHSIWLRMHNLALIEEMRKVLPVTPLPRNLHWTFHDSQLKPLQGHSTPRFYLNSSLSYTLCSSDCFSNFREYPFRGLLN